MWHTRHSNNMTKTTHKCNFFKTHTSVEESTGKKHYLPDILAVFHVPTSWLRRSWSFMNHWNNRKTLFRHLQQPQLRIKLWFHPFHYCEYYFVYHATTAMVHICQHGENEWILHKISQLFFCDYFLFRLPHFEWMCCWTHNLMYLLKFNVNGWDLMLNRISNCVIKNDGTFLCRCVINLLYTPLI